MKIKLFIPFIIALLAAPGAGAQPAPLTGAECRNIAETAFGNGERLTYTLGWELRGIMNASAGEVVFKTSLTTINGTPAYRIHANGRTLPNIRLFYDMNDTYETWLDMEDLKPLQFRSELKENKYRYKAEYIYDWNAMEVRTSYQNMKRPAPKKAVMGLTRESADAVAFFFKLRSQDIGSFTPGMDKSFDFVMDSKICRINFKFLGRETKKLGRVGTFKTLKLSCQLTSTDDKDGQTFEEGTEFYLWLSDDGNRIPLYIETPTKIGNIVATLRKYEGLKHPLDSKIK